MALEPPTEEELVLSTSTMAPEEQLQLFSHSREYLSSCMINRQPRITTHRQQFPERQQPSNNRLSILPTELVFEVLSYLDLKSLTNMRSVDFWTKNVIDAFPAYRYLLQYAPTALQALFDTRLIPCFASGILYDALRSEKCVGCDDFGSFLFLPLARRCCFNCLLYNSSLRVITVPAAQKCFGLNKDALTTLPKLFSLPGSYGSRSRQVKTRKWLVSVWGARERGIELHGGQDRMETFVLENCAKAQAIFARNATAWESRSESGSTGRRPTRPKLPKDILEYPNDPFQFFASAAFPLLHRDGSTLEHGVSCVGCQNFKANYHHDDETSNLSNLQILRKLERDDMKSYTRRGILPHFDRCPGIRRIEMLRSR